MNTTITKLVVAACLLSALSIPTHSANDNYLAIKTLIAAGKASYAAHSYSASIVSTNVLGDRQVGIIKCLKPNYLRVELWTIPKGKLTVPLDPISPHEMCISDGHVYRWVSKDGGISAEPASPTGQNFSAAMSIWDYFFMPDKQKEYVKEFKRATFHLHNGQWYGTRYRIVEITFAKADMRGAVDNKYTVYIGRNGIIEGVRSNGADQRYVGPVFTLYTRSRINPPLQPTDFTFPKTVVDKWAATGITVIRGRNSKALNVQ